MNKYWERLNGHKPQESGAILSSSCYNLCTGVDYISEFRFSSGRVEHVCNLCEVSLNAPVSLTEHASSLRHLLRFIVRTLFWIVTDVVQLSVLVIVFQSMNQNTFI